MRGKSLPYLRLLGTSPGMLAQVPACILRCPGHLTYWVQLGRSARMSNEEMSTAAGCRLRQLTVPLLIGFALLAHNAKRDSRAIGPGTNLVRAGGTGHCSRWPKVCSDAIHPYLHRTVLCA